MKAEIVKVIKELAETFKITDAEKKEFDAKYASYDPAEEAERYEQYLKGLGANF